MSSDPFQQIDTIFVLNSDPPSPSYQLIVGPPAVFMLVKRVLSLDLGQELSTAQREAEKGKP